MDSRLDLVAKAVARGATRREALRLAGGGLIGALLAAAGLGRRAGAQDGPPCGEFHARCDEQTVEACGPAPSSHEREAWAAWYACMEEQPACRTAYMACPRSCIDPYNFGECAGGCPGSQTCQSTFNPLSNRLICRCL